MESSIYTAMTTASKILENQEILANNLANISTTGFKSELVSKIILTNSNYDKNHDNLNRLNIYNTHYNTTQGALKYTNEPLDCAIKNINGWFIVRTKNNEIAFTKNGHFKINSQGLLTVQNHEVVGKYGSILIPKNVTTINISQDGTIKAKEKKSSEEIIINKLKLAKINVNNLLHKEHGFYVLNKNNKIKLFEDTTNSITILPKTLEDSNVNIVENMVHMISDTRNFEMQMKVLSIYDENTQLANKFLNISN